MIDLSTVLTVFLHFLACLVVFGGLYFILEFIARKFPGNEMVAMFVKFGEIFLVIAGVLVAIFILVAILVGGGNQPLFRWGSAPLR